MSVGAGIIWSTLIVLLAIAVWRTTVNKKWRTVGKVFGGIVLLGALFGASIWGWSEYQDRPQVVTELAGIAPGMKPVDVTLALGSPADKRGPIGGPDGVVTMGYLYRKDYDDDFALIIRFKKRNKDFEVASICEIGGNSDLLGSGIYSSEKEVLDKLGEPEATIIHKDGLKKLISFPRWQAAYVIEKGLVQGVCTSDDGVFEYAEEFAQAATDYTYKFVPDARPWERYKEDPAVEVPDGNTGKGE